MTENSDFKNQGTQDAIAQSGLKDVSAGRDIHVQLTQNIYHNSHPKTESSESKGAPQRFSQVIANPFQPLNGRIEQSEQFFNREKELRDIFEILNAGSGVELLGDRQIGKSSVLQQIKHRVSSALTVKWEPIYLK